MNRLVSTGLATAFFRLFILDALAAGPARPAALLARISTEKLPFASGAFGRALQSLLEGGHLAPAMHGAVVLTPLGALERIAERERWSAVLPTVARLIDQLERPPSDGPRISEMAEAPRPIEHVAVADAYLDRVLIATLRERAGDARDGGRPFAVSLGAIDLDHGAEATRRAMLHRAIRATLGGATTLFGGDASAFRYGEAGVAVIAPLHGDPARGEALTILVRARLDELMRTMTSTVRAFGGARWRIRAGGATWSPSIATSAQLLRTAEDALAADGKQMTPA
ncbi:MAG: hypothetical protein HY071_01195 [Chloroflexi bacterium]|nr:hypothetical protein [Chloroflexota bacterium]